MNYKDELERTMTKIAEIENSVFLGQAVKCPGTGMSDTLKGVPEDKKIELPVFENTQLGMSIGIALKGLLPISIFPRWNFLVSATDQLINHLDKISLMSKGGYNPKVIIRTAVGSESPLHPQHQHVGNFSDAYRMMFKTIEIVELQEPQDIYDAYMKAIDADHSTILVEFGDYYRKEA